MASLPLVVIETDSGAEVRLRGSEEPGEPYASLREALDSLLTDDDYRPKAGILRSESGEQVGAWRWLDATAEEPSPAEDGSQVTRSLIAAMAARLNSGSPAPMDGGTSEAHSQLSSTSTAADGYAHVGVEVLLRERRYAEMPADIDRSDERAVSEWEEANPPSIGTRWHLFLYCELDSAIARDVDSGRLAYGSIGFTNDGRLLQHALTNVPAVEGLRPNNSVRAPRGVRISFRSMRITMPKTPNAAKRATLAEAEPLLLEMTGASPEELGTKLIELVAAKNAEMADHAAEAEAEKPAEEPAAADATQRTDAPVAPPAEAPRAEGAFADAAAMEMFASEALNLLRDIFGVADEAPAAVLEKAKASLAAFKGAVGQAAPPADAGAMSAQQPEAQRSVSDAAKRALDENAALKAEIAKRDTRDAIAKRAADAKVTLTNLEQLVADALAVSDASARERLIDTAIRAAQVVPTGRVFGDGAASSMQPQTISEARAQLEESVRREFPRYGNNEVRATALRKAQERWPHLFESQAR